MVWGERRLQLKNQAFISILLLSVTAVGVGNGRDKTGLEEKQMPWRVSSNYDGEGLKEREEFGSWRQTRMGWHSQQGGTNIVIC